MSLSVHIRHEVRPERMREVICCIAEGIDFDHVTQSERQLRRLRQLNLLHENTLSRQASLLIELAKDDESIWGEVFHYLHYISWSPAVASENGFSWLYRNFSDYLWNAGSIKIDTDFLHLAVSYFINKVEEVPYFESVETESIAVSLSPDSLRGALHFLAALKPAVVDDNVFQRRHFCKPASVLLATAYVARETEASLGIDMLLTPERRDAICKLCLLEPATLDQTLDWMLPIYPEIVEPGTTSGIYGRFLRFIKWPAFEDLAIVAK